MTPHPSSLPEAVIFDMDGVIVDSEPSHERAFLDVVEAIGYTGRHNLRLADYVGRSDKVLWEDFVAANNPPLPLHQLLAMKRSRVVELLRQDKPFFPGLRELVSALALRYKLGLASGSERTIVDEVLRLDPIGSSFTVSVSGSDVSNSKPDPEIFLKTAALLGVSPSKCWAVEDSKPGIAAGLAAGMCVVAVANTHPANELSHAHFVVSKYEEIQALLCP